MEDREAVLPKPVSGRHRGSFSRQSVPPQAGVLLKPRFQSIKYLLLSKKDSTMCVCVVFFKRLEAITLMTPSPG